jgi:hypothetical protein
MQIIATENSPLEEKQDEMFSGQAPFFSATRTDSIMPGTECLFCFSSPSRGRWLSGSVCKRFSRDSPLRGLVVEVNDLSEEGERSLVPGTSEGPVTMVFAVLERIAQL